MTCRGLLAVLFILAAVAPSRGQVPTKKIIVHGVAFDPHDRTIFPESAPVLDEAAQMLHEGRDLIVTVACDREDAGAYPDLRRRAGSVHDYFVAQGVPVENITVVDIPSPSPPLGSYADDGSRNPCVELSVN